MSIDEGKTAPPRGRTRWLRFGGTMLAVGVAAGTMVLMTAQGVLAASFKISGLPFAVTATQLTGDGFEQFATLDQMPDGSPNAGDTGGQVVVIVSAIQHATLTNLCQSIQLGGTFIKITAGDAGTPVDAQTLVTDSDAISGDAKFKAINIGQDASTLDKVSDNGTAVTGNLGILGQQAEHVEITNLRQNNFATTAATFSLPNLHISFSSTGC